MEITKKNLEEKLKQYSEQYAQTQNELNRFNILVRKYEGAIEATQLLLKDLEEDENKEDKKIISKR